MNAIEDNEFTQGWREIAKVVGRPKAIVAVSAHWFTEGTRIADQEPPEMIYDMYGFPDALYEIVYGATGSEWLRQRLESCLGGVDGLDFSRDDSWGFDHGAWSVLHVMYPDADIPVVQLSIDRHATPEWHHRIGQSLKALRDDGVLILGSGNVVHSFTHMRWNMEGGHPWALDFDKSIRDAIINGDHGSILSYQKSYPNHRLAFQTSDHFDPLLTVLGAVDPSDQVKVYNEQVVMGSMSMTSYIIG